MINGVDHIAINTMKLEQSKQFYMDVLGLEVEPRPDIEIPGCWLRANGRDFLHLFQMGSDVPPSHGGIDHFAMSIDDMESARARLEKHNITYREHALPDGSRRQFFFDDPNGIMVELTWRAG